MTINKYKNHWQQHQAHLWGLKPPHHTHLGNRFFEFEYINIIQDSFSLLLSSCRNVTLRSHIPCRNVTLRSPNTTVSERDTPIQYYRVGTWHSDPFISLFLFRQAFFMSRRHLNREDLRLKIQQSHHSNPPQLHNQNIQTHSQAHRRLYNTTQYILIAI